MCWPRFQVITVVRTFSACPFYIPHFTAILWFNALYPEESVWSKGVTLAVLATQKCICLVAHATHQSFPVSCQGYLNQVLQCAVTRLRDQKLSEGHSCSLPFHPETRRWPQHWFSILGVGGVVVFFIKYVTDLVFFFFRRTHAGLGGSPLWEMTHIRRRTFLPSVSDTKPLVHFVHFSGWRLQNLESWLALQISEYTPHSTHWAFWSSL